MLLEANPVGQNDKAQTNSQKTKASRGMYIILVFDNIPSFQKN